MKWFGSGTPLPIDAPNRLVMVGPYCYVRNPMAIAGLGQGFAVAIILKSIWVGLYFFITKLLFYSDPLHVK